MVRSWPKPLERKLLRDLWRSRAQVLAVSAVVMCGVAIHVAMQTVMKDLFDTRAAYYEKYRFADLFFRVERAPSAVLSRLAALPGVEAVEGRIVRDAVLSVPGNPDPVSGRIVSIRSHRRPQVNDLCLTRGNWPSEGGRAEALVDPRFAAANGISRGTALSVAACGRIVPVYVCGEATCPEFIYAIRDAASLLPDHKAFGVVYLPHSLAESLFGFEGAFNDAVVRLDGSRKPDEVLADAEAVLEPFGLYMKIGRADHLSAQFLDNEIKQLLDMTNVVPPVFLGVAAVAIFVLMQRLVRSQRTQIGVLKASGTSDAALLAHYVGFSLAIALTGSTAGIAAGDALARMMLAMYGEHFQFPFLRHGMDPAGMAAAAVTAVLFCAVAGSLASLRVMRMQPAEAMRPPSPPGGGPVFLERVPLIWNLLPFQAKVVVRSVSRQKGRAAFNFTAVTLSCAVMTFSMAMMDAVEGLIGTFVENAQRQDAKVGLDVPRPLEALSDLRAIEGVTRAEPLFEAPFELRNGWKKKTAVVTGMTRDGRMRALVDSAGGIHELPRRGLLLNSALAAHLGAAPGDMIAAKSLFPGHSEKDISVAAVFEEDVGLNGYMEIAELSRFIGEPPVFNSALLRIAPGKSEQVKARIKQMPPVAGVTLSSRMLANFREVLEKTMGAAITIYMLFGGVIAFAVIFNSASVSLAERSRELASLMVLGYTRLEVSALFFGEFFLLVLAGIVPGLMFGTMIAKGTMDLYGTDTFRFSFTVSNGSYATAAGLTLLFSALAAAAAGRAISKLDLVEALKAWE